MWETIEKGRGQG